MNYIMKPEKMTSAFFVPSEVVETHLKLASGNQIKVLLCFLKNISSGIKVVNIAEFLKLPEAEVADALEFWAQAGVLANINAPAEKKEETSKSKKAIKPVTVKPTREEIASVAVGDNKLAFLLGEAEMKLGRSMRNNEIQNLAWLYLDHGMDVSLILMLVEYAVSESKATVSFIEATALDWINSGVTTIADAEKKIEERNRQKTAWGMVESAFGIEHRMPSDKELEYAKRWIIDWHFSREMLKEAYNRCIDHKAKLSMSYINGILERWYKDGVSTLTDETKSGSKTKPDKSGKATYDKNLVDRILNKD